MMENMSYTDIGIIVAAKAQEIFEDCGAKDDYCIQCVGAETVVFGGCNRLTWSPTSGFYPDADYCSDSFMRMFKRQYK